MTWLLKGGRVIDPAAGVDAQLDVLLADGRVQAVDEEVRADARVLDCRGKYVVPGLIDLAARVGEPGFEHRETVATATAAAAVGGFAALAALPEGDPLPDTPQAMIHLREVARREGFVRIYPVAALTKGAAGRELTEADALREAGGVALAALAEVQDGGVLRRALQYAGMVGLPILLGGSDPALADGGVMHEGVMSTIQGLKGIPAAAEEIAVARRLILAEATRVPVHLLGVSTAGAVARIRDAKARGVPVTASVSVHHLVFTDEDVQADDPRWKLDPPLRSRTDMETLRQGVADGTIDAVMTDHSPWGQEETDVEFDAAPFGIVGLETGLGLVLDALVHGGVVPLERIVASMSWAPARILGVGGGTLQPGAYGDVTVIDLDRRWTFSVAQAHSLSRHTPVDGRPLRGRAVATFVHGKLVMRDGRIVHK